MPSRDALAILLLPAVMFSAQAQTGETPKLSGEAFALADEAYKLHAQGQYDEALKKTDEALALAPEASQLQSLKRDLHFAKGSAEDYEKAEELNGKLLIKNPQDPALYLFRVYLRQRQGRLEEAIQCALDIEKLQGVKPDAVRQAQTAAAYVHLAKKDDASAVSAFKKGLGADSSSGAWLDAAYAAKRLGQNDEADRCFRGALDAAEVGAPETSASPMSLQTRFGLRRELSDNSREFGLNGTTTHRQVGYIRGLSVEQKAVQQSLEFFWQPKQFYSQGRHIQLYGQMFANLYDPASTASAGDSMQGVLGLRVKPFGSENLVLGVQKMVKLGKSSMDDWMFRAGYSACAGTDMQPWSREGWSYFSFYTEGAYLVKKQQYSHSLEGRLGRNWMLGGTTVLTPYLMTAGDYSNLALPSFAGSVGAGITLRHWFRQTKHKAPASWVELTLQGHAKLSEADRSEGMFASLSFWF